MTPTVGLADVDVLILAGGLGTRLRPVWDGAKCLAPVAGVPFLEHLLRQVTNHGAKRVVLALRHKAWDVVDYTRARQRDGLEVDFSIEAGDERHGEIYGMLHVWAALKQRVTLILNGDTYVNVDLGRLVGQHLATRRKRALTLFYETGSWSQCPVMGRHVGLACIQTIAVPYVVDRAALDATGLSDIEHNPAPVVINPAAGTWWVDIGTPEGLARAERLLATPTVATRRVK